MNNLAPGSQKAHDALVCALMTLCVLRRVPVLRLNQRPVQKRDGSWSSPGADPGAPDLIAMHRGRLLWVEAKTGEVRLRPVQRAAASLWSAAGAIVVVARSVDDLDAILLAR